MNCRQAKELLIPFLDGELPAQLQAEVEEHLAACDDCARERDLLAASWRSLERYETPKVSAGFTVNLMARIRSRKGAAAPAQLRQRPTFSRYRQRLAWAAAACLVVGVGIGALVSLRSRDQGTLTPTGAQRVAAREVTDEEIVRDLHLYENETILRDLDLFADLDVIEQVEEAGS